MLKRIKEVLSRPRIEVSEDVEMFTLFVGSKAVAWAFFDEEWVSIEGYTMEQVYALVEEAEMLAEVALEVF